MKPLKWNLATKIAVGSFIYLLLLITANAETSPSDSAVTPYCEGENIESLLDKTPPALTPSEKLQTFRKIHNEFLLLSPRFSSNLNIERIFGAPPNKEYWKEYAGMVAKEIDGKDVAGTPSRLIFFFSAIRERGATTYEANITFQPQKNDYSVDMVEKFLTKEIKGTDSLKEHVLNGQVSPHARDAWLGRPLPTHPKGYFEYHATSVDGICSSKLDVRLNKDGSVFDVSIRQKYVLNTAEEQRESK